jgi:hypothetical protein
MKTIRLTENANGMHGLDAFEHLLGETLVMHFGQCLLALDNVVQIAIHQLPCNKSLQLN